MATGQRGWLAWLAVAGAMAVPVALAAASPYLAYRNPAYILGGFAGITCLALLLVQPLLGAGYLPGLPPARTRRWHRRVGSAIVLCVVLHVGGLFVTSPPDTIDALLLVAPTPFSVYGVLAMWGIFLTAGLVIFRRRTRLGPQGWTLLHNLLALVVVVATVVHAVQIEGAMEPVSKAVLCALVLIATAAALVDVRILRRLRARRGEAGVKVRPSPSVRER